MGIADRIKPILREPLAHFLIAGAAVFGLNATRDTPPDPAGRTIVIDETQVRRLTDTFVQSWQRPPTAAEVDGLIRDYIREEIYYREALRLGLDSGDLVIRRRLRNKMEFLARSEIESATPGEATLKAWLDRDPAKYAGGAKFDFDQVYVGGNDASAARRRALALQAQLARGADPAGLGDALSVPRYMAGAGSVEVARIFGDGFAAALASLPQGRWVGPVQSGYGVHVVRVTRIVLPSKPQLQDVRQAVENDWREATAEKREAQSYQALLDGYTIRIERPR